MSKVFFGILGLIAMQVVGGALAQPAPTPTDLALRPGDRITWVPESPHRVQFGGPAGVTSYTDVRKVLKDINPPLPDGPVATFPEGARVTATVRDDFAASGLSSFNFTCGFNPHTPVMITVPFTLAAGTPARDVQIVSGMPRKWILKTPTGDKLLGGN